MSIKKIGMKYTNQELPAKDIQLSHTRSKWKRRIPPRKNVPNQNVREKQREWRDILYDAILDKEI